MFENSNSLGIFMHSLKLDRLNYLIRHLKLDIVMGWESRCNWRFVGPRHQFLDILCPGLAKVGVAANNTNEYIHREQMGGTAIAALGRICDITTEIGHDPTGLARYTWIQLNEKTTKTRLICEYIPCQPGKNSKGRTVWDQASWYFQSKGDF
jgi:hypothetical protein